MLSMDGAFGRLGYGRLTTAALPGGASQQETDRFERSVLARAERLCFGRVTSHWLDYDYPSTGYDPVTGSELPARRNSRTLFVYCSTASAWLQDFLLCLALMASVPAVLAVFGLLSR